MCWFSSYFSEGLDFLVLFGQCKKYDIEFIPSLFLEKRLDKKSASSKALTPTQAKCRRSNELLKLSP
jgi:hypothetical protein